ncbi:MAG: hypothetical protein JWN09_121 [Microbacteriaceae bacterium]|nr:hypothetical protein [Microbacteriaceae bacterium]
MTQAIDIARNYLNAFYADDRAATRALLADDFDFGGPFSGTIGADEFLDSARRLLVRLKEPTSCVAGRMAARCAWCTRSRSRDIASRWRIGYRSAVIESLASASTSTRSSSPRLSPRNLPARSAVQAFRQPWQCLPKRTITSARTTAGTPLIMDLRVRWLDPPERNDGGGQIRRLKRPQSPHLGALGKRPDSALAF